MNVAKFGIPAQNAVCTKRLIDPMTGEILVDTGDIIPYEDALKKTRELNKAIVGAYFTRYNTFFPVESFVDHFYVQE